MLKFKILSIFPKYFVSPFMDGLMKGAIDRGDIMIDVIDIRDFTNDKYKTVDDTPYGGGAGMVMKPEPIVSAIKYAKAAENNYRVIVFSPRGRKFDQSTAKAYSAYTKYILVCGRYEGIDERVSAFYADEEISIGDYILSGGESAALVFMEAVSRLMPGFVGNSKSIADESYENGLLEYQQYTKPREFEGHSVPEVLLSGNHKKIQEWRMKQSREITARRRPDLLASTAKDRHIVSVIEPTEKRN